MPYSPLAHPLARLLPPKLVQISSTSQNSAAQVAQLARLRPARCTTLRQELCPLHHGKISGCPLRHGDLGSLARYLSLIPQLHPKETHPTTSWWIQVHFNPCQGRHLLQEGFGMSSSPVLCRQGAGHDVISFEAWLQMRFVPKQVVRHEPSM